MHLKKSTNQLVTESFTNQKTRLTIVHERLFSINRLVPLMSVTYLRLHKNTTACNTNVDEG
jgi:hypothetical protein